MSEWMSEEAIDYIYVNIINNFAIGKQTEFTSIGFLILKSVLHDSLPKVVVFGWRGTFKFAPHDLRHVY